MQILDRIRLIKGDITKIEVGGIVNAANNSLLGGGGVDGAIHRVGGNAILEECKRIGGCPTGEAVITTAGQLPAQYVIHTVGPIWKGGHKNEAELLLSCYRKSLQLAVRNEIYSVAFPNISTGVYAFPKVKASEIATKSVLEFLASDTTIREVLFVCFDDENYTLYLNALYGITRDGIEAVTAFIPQLEAGNISDGVLNDLFSTLERHNFLQKMDAEEWKRKENFYISSLHILDADVSFVIEILTLIFRGDQFSSGLINTFTKSEILLVLLRRLKELCLKV